MKTQPDEASSNPPGAGGHGLETFRGFSSTKPSQEAATPAVTPAVPGYDPGLTHIRVDIRTAPP